MAKPPTRTTPSPASERRRGEGTLLTAIRISAPDPGMVGWQADLSQAPIPDKKYSAAVADVGVQHGEFLLMFGQSKVQQAELRSLIVIKFARGAMNAFLRSLDHLDGAQLQEIAAQRNAVAEDLPGIDSEPSQTVEFRANIGAIAMVDDEACIDFYRTSAFALRDVQITNQLAVDPVVRVDLRITLFLGVIRKLRVLGAHLETANR